jgi:type II secretory pathway pseudopilin PulG
MIKFLKDKNNGFTIVELIVVFSVITMLASFLILYSKSSNSQVVLSLETSKLVEFLNKAKSLSISTYTEKGAACGYGINIDYRNNSYTLFKYGSPSPNNCKNIASSSINFLDQTYIELQNNSLPPSAKFEKKNNYLNTIFFMPPDPKILIWKNDGPLPTQEDQAFIYLLTKDQSYEKTIEVNIAGQISY